MSPRTPHRRLSADDYVQLTPIGTPMDVALDRAFKKLGISRLGGASGRGWSSNAVFMSCPKRFFLSTRKSKVAEKVEPEGRAVGALFHAFMALYYVAMIEGDADLPTPEQLRDAVYDEKAYAQWVSEAWRLFHHYASRYEEDYIEPLAVEHWVEGRYDTARYDLIARVLPNPLGMAPGVYDIDHKSGASNNESFRDGWRNDPEFLTQMLVWREAKLDKVFGPLQGVMMNGIIKTQTVQFHRTVIAPNWRLVREHERELRVSQAEKAHCKATGYWPMRGRAHGCIFRYGKCEHYEECAR